MKTRIRIPVLEILALGTLALLAAPLALRAAAADSSITLQSVRKPGTIDRVELKLEVGGDMNELVDGNVQTTKMSVTCDLGFDEKTLAVPSGGEGPWRSVRYYDAISAVIKLADDGFKPQLRPGRQLMGVEIDSPTLTYFSPHGPLRREELELIDIVADSLLLDRLLPDKPVAKGDSWKLSEPLLVAMLNLDAVSETNVQSAVTDITDSAVNMQMEGNVEGAFGGVSTEIALKAKYRFNRKTKRIDWLGLLVQEKRDIGHIEPGFDVVIRLQLKVTPKAGSEHLTDEALAGLVLEPTDTLRELAYESPKGGFQFIHARNWYIKDARSDRVTLRMLDRGDLVAQCNVAALPKLAAGKEVSLSEFQNDVQAALDKNFGQFTEARQSASKAGYRIYRVVARGTASELPIQWNYYLVADQQGRRVAFAFVVESDLVDRLNKDDEKLVNSLRFLDPKVASAQ